MNIFPIDTRFPHLFCMVLCPIAMFRHVSENTELHLCHGGMAKLCLLDIRRQIHTGTLRENPGKKTGMSMSWGPSMSEQIQDADPAVIEHGSGQFCIYIQLMSSVIHPCNCREFSSTMFDYQRVNHHVWWSNPLHVRWGRRSVANCLASVSGLIDLPKDRTVAYQKSCEHLFFYLLEVFMGILYILLFETLWLFSRLCGSLQGLTWLFKSPAGKFHYQVTTITWFDLMLIVWLWPSVDFQYHGEYTYIIYDIHETMLFITS